MKKSNKKTELKQTVQHVNVYVYAYASENNAVVDTYVNAAGLGTEPCAESYLYYISNAEIATDANSTNNTIEGREVYVHSRIDKLYLYAKSDATGSSLTTR